MKRERVNKALENEMQIASATQRLEAAKAKVASLEQRLRALENKQLRLRLESQSPLGRSTRKNQKKYTVWNNVRETLMVTLSDGLTTAELYKAARDEHRNLNLITFRAYLREFEAKHLLHKRHDRWHLAQAISTTAV